MGSGEMLEQNSYSAATQTQKHSQKRKQFFFPRQAAAAVAQLDETDVQKRKGQWFSSQAEQHAVLDQKPTPSYKFCA